MSDYDWDHIDPDYPKGADRPYQLVCGLTNSFNLIERDKSTNSSKSNRFLPWRVAKEEIGSVPVNLGDLCQFLDRETGEWVLEEFMGDWWFAQTKGLCGQSVSGKQNKGISRGVGHPGKIAGAKKAGQKTFLEKTGLHAPGMASLGGKSGKGKPGRRSLNGAKTNSTKLLCLLSGKISTSGPLTRWQRKRGINTSLRVPMKVVYFLVRSLYLV